MKKSLFISIQKGFKEPNRYHSCINCGDEIGVNDYQAHLLTCRGLESE